MYRGDGFDLTTRRKRLRLSAFTAALVVCGIGTNAALAWKIDEAEVLRLSAEAYNWPESHIWLDRQEGSFYIIAPLGGEVEAPVTWLGVNLWTGDVWNTWRCKRLSTARLRKSQAAIRRRFRLDEWRQYARLHKLRPDCSGP